MRSDSRIDIGGAREGSATTAAAAAEGAERESKGRAPGRNAGPAATLGTLRARGVEVPWTERASAAPGAAVVLLAGFGWRASGCVRAGWLDGPRRAIALDWPRRWPRRPLRTMARLAAVYGDALAELGVHRAHLAGVSTGGMVALELALARPELVASLALVSTAASAERVAGAWRLPASRALAGLLPPEPFFRFFRRWGPTLVGTSALAAPDEAARLWTDPMGRRKAADLLGALASFDVRGRLSDVQVPALVVHGRRDAILPPAAAEELARRLPRARLAVIEGGTHFVFLTHRAQVERELQRLWREEESR